MDSLKSKTALVTGASRGIGEAAAREFSSRGANTLLLARSSVRIDEIATSIRDRGGQALAVAGDVSRHEDLVAAVRAAEDAWGAVDILVNNAGVIEPVATLAESDPEDWSQVVDINLKGVYYGIRAVLPGMLERGSGVVINISSGAATSALEGWSHYCATKAAVLSLTRCLHKEYADRGIRSVGLSPGTVATDMQVAIKASGVNPVSQLDPSVHIAPEAVARAIAWLCTDEAREFDGDDFSLRTDHGRAVAGLDRARH